MSATILDGKALAEKIIQESKRKTNILKPTLAVIIVGNDPASKIYVRNKKKSCERAGIHSLTIELPEETTQQELIEEIEKLNTDPKINGFIVQLPLPVHISTPKIIRAIDPKKDVDGFHAYNLGKMFLSPEFEDLPPATPAGIIRLLEEYNIEIEGKEAVVVGHSKTVGKPISTMLLNRNATVTTCHIHTKDLKSHTKRADILVVAVGKPNLITADMVKEGVVVIDVGINRLENGKIVGDTDFDAIKQKASFISPVPGGVGPMTVASLMQNTITATSRNREQGTINLAG
jgi:methylenetetrahydrofolate dehydrogenase (NADP+)/methenyltetrahydrofolate cyclohydrolase